LGFTKKLKVPRGTKTIMIIKTVNDALSLKEGGLVLSIFQVSFSTENVVECAKLIIENNDKTEFYTQAGVIAHAGNNYGWGTGEGYRTC
jgi:soluble P-type ATPase